MARMHHAAPLEASLSPSRIARVWVICLAFGTLALTLTLPVEWWAGAGAAVPIAAWTALWFRDLRVGRHAACRLRVDGDRTLSLTTLDGRTLRGRILPSTYVGARLTALVWRPEGRRFARAQCVLPDMLPAEDFRRLRVLLRYGRSEPTQGAPPSQA